MAPHHSFPASYLFPSPVALQRLLCFATLSALAIATPAQAKTKTVVPNAKEAPRVLLLDTAPIWKRYIDAGDEPREAYNRKIALIAEMQPMLRRFAAKAGAAVVLDKQALLA